MRHFLLAPLAALAFVTAAAAPANAQIVIINGDGSLPGGFYSITAPRYYGGLAINNGVITTFPSFGYPGFGYTAPNSYFGYPSYPGRYPFSPGGYGYPGVWRP